MALSKTLELPTRVDVTYWRILRVVHEPDAGHARADVAGYVDSAARNDGGAPVEVREKYRRYGEGETPENIGRPEIYTWLKTLSDFTGASDV